MSGIFAPTAPIKFDANGNVLSNIAAQSINPTIANSYLPILLSHQTGLSITASTANTFYAIGSAISVTRNGIIVISMFGHVSAGQGNIQLKLTRGSNTFSWGIAGQSLFGDIGQSYFIDTTATPLYVPGGYTSVGLLPYFLLPVYSGDSLQFYATNNTAGDITYVDDLLVMLQ